MSGGFDAILKDVTTLFPADLGSVVTDFGTEFMSSVSALEAFQIPNVDVSKLGGFGQIGSLAGNASWVNTFNPGSILSSIPSVSDFNVGSLTSSLPSLSSIKGLTSTVTGIAGTAAGISRTASGGLTGLSNLNTNSLVSSGAAALGINPSTASSLTAKATSLFTTNPTSTTAIDEVTRLPINTPREVDAYGLAILTDQESSQLTRNATLINSFTDPSVPTVNTYPEAITSQQELTPYIASIQNSIIGNNKTITDTKKNIEELEANLRDPDLTRTQQELLETQIDANYAILAEAEDNNLYNQTILGEAVEQYSFDQEIITRTDASATNRPADVFEDLQEPPGTEEIFTDLAEPVDPDADPELLGGPDEGEDVYTPIREPGEVDEPELLGGPDEELVQLSGPTDVETETTTGPRPTSTTANTVVGAPVANLVAEARKQQTLRNLTQTKAQATDWRVKLRLAPNSTYLYNDPTDPGILSPLSAKTGTDGVIFPYTPAIETAYKANYDQYDLTHSNYRGYFYKNSYVDAINMRCTFTAQDTSEANYLLAVIHFFRSVTKMFYGQDAQRGSPPPLVFLSGLGDYQFNEHPCVVSQFNYTLPPDVDYVRAYSTLDMSTNLLDNRTRTSISGNPLSYGINRLLNSGLFSGAIPTTKSPGNLETKQPTYVPTKMEISISLLPIQSRQQVSTQFSLKGFANGNLLKGGFW
jgi:hypothetical protein